MLNIASRYKDEGKTDDHKRWLERARFDAPGDTRLQQAIKEMIGGIERENIFEVVFPPPPQPETHQQADA